MKCITNFRKLKFIGSLKNKGLILKIVQIENHIFNLHDFEYYIHKVFILSYLICI